MLDLDAIRRRWAATPWTNGRTPELADDIAAMFSELDRLRSEVTRLQDLADARLYRAHTARITLESVGIPRSEPVDVSAARAAGMIEDLRAELDRLTAALVAAQAAPVVVWRRIRDFDRADLGAMHLHVDDKGWLIRVVDLGTEELATIAEGPETGPAGKAACLAAYRRACGFPTAPPCAG